MTEPKAKPPAFQFYPGDWLRDPAVRACSMGARGLWIDMLAYMHQAEPYGHLVVGHLIVDPPHLAAMVGAKAREVTRWLAELETAGVFSRLEDGTIYSRRMVRDEHIRRVRANGGPKSLEHPNVPRPKDPAKDILSPVLPDDEKDPQKEGTAGGPSMGPSGGPLHLPSSSSSASAERERRSRGSRLPPDFALTDPRRAYAIGKGVPAWVVGREFEKFTAHFRGAAGRQGVKLDWDAAWQKWVLGVEPPRGGWPASAAEPEPDPDESFVNILGRGKVPLAQAKREGLV